MLETDIGHYLDIYIYIFKVTLIFILLMFIVSSMLETVIGKSFYYNVINLYNRNRFDIMDTFQYSNRIH